MDARTAIARTRGSASGGSGSEEARRQQARYAGGALAVPPKPPAKPKNPGGVHELPWMQAGVERRLPPGGWKDAQEFYEYYHKRSNEGERNVSEDKLRSVFGNVPFISAYQHVLLRNASRTNVAQYQKDMDVWNPLNDAYQADLGNSQRFNTEQAGYQTAETEGRGVAREKAAAGRGGGGGEQGVDQGAISSSPWLSMIKRPDTVWL